MDLNKARILGLTGSILGSFGFTAMLIYFIAWPILAGELISICVALEEAQVPRLADSDYKKCVEFTLLLLVFGSPLIYMVGLASFIQVLRSLGILSSLYRERGIFRYALISVIILYGASFVVVMLIIYIVRESLGSPPTGDFLAALGLGILWFISLLIFLVAFTISAFPWFIAFRRLASKSGVTLFRWHALLHLIASILPLASLIAIFALSIMGFVFDSSDVILLGASFVFVVFVVLELAGWIILITAFYKLKLPQSLVQP